MCDKYLCGNLEHTPSTAQQLYPLVENSAPLGQGIETYVTYVNNILPHRNTPHKKQSSQIITFSSHRKTWGLSSIEGKNCEHTTK